MFFENPSQFRRFLFYPREHFFTSASVLLNYPVIWLKKQKSELPHNRYRTINGFKIQLESQGCTFEAFIFLIHNSLQFHSEEGCKNNFFLHFDIQKFSFFLSRNDAYKNVVCVRTKSKSSKRVKDFPKHVTHAYRHPHS